MANLVYNPTSKPFWVWIENYGLFLIYTIQRTFEPKRKTMFSDLIIGLVELIHEDEWVVDRMQENECGGVYIDKYTWWRLFYYLLLKKNKNKCIYIYKIWVNKRKRKKGIKRQDSVLKVRIGGCKYKWRSVAPLV